MPAENGCKFEARSSSVYFMRILLIAALALAGCSRPASVGVKTDPVLQTLVPGDTVLMVGTRLEALEKTPVYQKYFAGRQFSQIEEFAQRTGLDPRKDLWELLFVSNGKQSVLLGRGKFANEMEPRLEKEGAQRMGYKGFNLIGNEQAAVLFINSSTAAVASIADLKDFVDKRGTAKGLPPALAAAIKEILPESQFWAAYTGGAVHLPIDPHSTAASLNKLIESIQSATVYFDFRSGLNSVAAGMCPKDEEEQQEQASLKALFGLGRLHAPAYQQALLQAYDRILAMPVSHRAILLFVLSH